MKAVILEDYAIQQGDLDWSGVKALVPDITRYGRTAQEEVVPRIGDAEIVFLNKCRIDEAVLAQCPKLRWVGIIATGTDNLDLKACRRHLGGDTSLACSAQTQREIDQRVVELVKAQHEKAIKILTDNRAKLDELAKYLYEKETITGDEFMAILEEKDSSEN